MRARTTRLVKTAREVIILHGSTADGGNGPPTARSRDPTADEAAPGDLPRVRVLDARSDGSEFTRDFECSIRLIVDLFSRFAKHASTPDRVIVEVALARSGPS